MFATPWLLRPSVCESKATSPVCSGSTYWNCRVLKRVADGTSVELTATTPSTPAGRLDNWLQLNDGIFTASVLTPPPRDALLACSWPPWFTFAIWRWLQERRWSDSVRQGRCHFGVSYLELLVDFVVQTGVCPPDSLQASLRDTTQPLFWTRTFTVRQLTHNLVEAVRQLERLSGQRLFGPKRNKVFSLRMLGHQTACHGLSRRPYMKNCETVGALLQSVLAQNSVEPIQRFVQAYTGPVFHQSELQKSWSSLTRANRAALSFSLRRSRR